MVVEAPDAVGTSRFKGIRQDKFSYNVEVSRNVSETL
jgi:hypothetical protein